jgi:hypothetical protein
VLDAEWGEARRREGAKARRHGGTEARRHGGTEARRHGGTKKNRGKRLIHGFYRLKKGGREGQLTIDH